MLGQHEHVVQNVAGLGDVAMAESRHADARHVRAALMQELRTRQRELAERLRMMRTEFEEAYKGPGAL